MARLGTLYEFTAFHLALSRAGGRDDLFARRVLGDLEVALDQLDSVR